MAPSVTPEPRKNIRFQTPAPSIRRLRVRGQARELGGDLYFAMITWPFWQFCLVVGATVLVLNALFAALYMLDPGGISNARAGSFEDAFFFSVQTLATIGYGAMAPQTRFTHIVVTIESILGVLAVGSLAGVAFARLSRPKARVLFSDRIVIGPRNGVPHAQFRVANWRGSLIVDANLKVFVLVEERTAEGDVTRRPLDVKLVRPASPFFYVTWTAMHCIDEQSPFYGEGTVERLRAAGAQVFATLTGYDPTLGQTIHAYREYKFEDVIDGARFVDVITSAADGTREIDFSRYHDTEPL